MTEVVPVLYVDNSSTFGGAINTLSDLVAELEADGIGPVVVSRQSREVLERLFPGAEVHVSGTPVPWVVRGRLQSLVRRSEPVGRFLMRLRGVWWILRHHLPDALRLARIGRGRGVRLVHLNNTVESQLSGLLAARLLSVPCLAHARSPQTPTKASRRYAAMADLHVAISGVIAENLRSLGVPNERIVHVHDGIDLEAFHAGPARGGLREELGLPGNGRVVALFGRIVPWKGVREYVDAAAVVLRELPDAYALVVGDRSDGDESYAEVVRDRARAVGMESRIVFTGFRSDVPDVMRLCDVVVHMSLIPEPFGLVVAEALSTGTPVVASDRGGPTEIVDHGETGLLVDPRNAPAVADAILRLLRDPEGARRMGRLGERRMKERFSARRSADEILSVYERMLDSERMRQD